MPLTLYQFNLLPDEERANTLWDEGVYLAFRQGPGFTGVLYSLSTFFVEVVYSQRTNEILYLRAFRSTDALLPYLQDIRVI